MEIKQKVQDSLLIFHRVLLFLGWTYFEIWKLSVIVVQSILNNHFGVGGQGNYENVLIWFLSSMKYCNFTSHVILLVTLKMMLPWFRTDPPNFYPNTMSKLGIMKWKIKCVIYLTLKGLILGHRFAKFFNWCSLNNLVNF